MRLRNRPRKENVVKYVGTKAASRRKWFGLTPGVEKKKAVRGSTALHEG